MSQAFNPGDRVCLVAKWTEKNGNLVQDCGTVVDVRISGDRWSAAARILRARG